MLTESTLAVLVGKWVQLHDGSKAWLGIKVPRPISRTVRYLGLLNDQPIAWDKEGCHENADLSILEEWQDPKPGYLGNGEVWGL